MDRERLNAALERVIPLEDTRRGFLWYLAQAGTEDHRAIADAMVSKEHSENGAHPRNLYPLLSDLEVENLPVPEQGIEGIYPHGGLVMLYGPRGIGKTFLALGWSFGHALGTWLGRRAVIGPTVHIIAEGRAGLRMRVRAQKQHLGIQGQAGVYFVPTAVPMLNAVEVDRLIETIKLGLVVPPAAICWDTLSRTFVGGDENSSKDMAVYVAAIDRVKAEVGGTALVAHHSGHTGDRERGSSVLGGAADTIVALREKDNGLEVACEKQKDGPAFAPLCLGLKRVGESCVLVHDQPWTSPESLSRVEADGLRVLHDSFLADGAAATTWLDVSKMPKSSFYKGLKSLVERGLVRVKESGNGKRYTVTEDGARLLKVPRSTEGPR